MKRGTQTTVHDCIIFHSSELGLQILLHKTQVAENIANMINVLRKFLIPSTPIGSS